MKRKRLWIIVSVLVLLGLMLASCGGTAEEPPAAEEPAAVSEDAEEEQVSEEAEAEELTPIKMTVALSSPHVWIQPVIAQYAGFFEEVGLDVELVRFATGRAAMDALIGGQADVCTTAISPAIFASFQNQPIAILAENARFPGEKFTARVASGIGSAEDLRGKKIGVTLGSDHQYFLHLFLQYYGMTEDDVQILNLGPADMVISLVNGDVDAFSSWRPQPDNAKAEMGDGAIFLEQPDPPFFESLYILVGMQNLVAENPEAYDRFMKAMVMADEFAASNPEEATAFVADISEVDVAAAENLMSGYIFKIWLDQSMVTGAEDRAQWQIDFDLAPEGAVMPNFRDFIYEDSLLKADPERVSLD